MWKIEVYQVYGVEGIKMISNALMIMKKTDNSRACYWKCSLCSKTPNIFHESKEFLTHIEEAHVEITFENGQKISCGICKVIIYT